MKHQIRESKASTYYYRKKGIPKGCKLCLKGRKSVLFINGLCQKPSQCYWYCPLSKTRKGSPTSYINEIQFKERYEIIDEIKLCQSRGIGITGGEPLSPFNITNTISLIKFLKNKIGTRFHIHLYTNGINFSENIASELESSGLDEIRFHPNITNFNKIKYVLKRSMHVGLELPIIPSKDSLEELREKIYLADNIGLDFINLNEFEMCETNSKALIERNYLLRKNSSASVLNSFESALILLEELREKVGLKLHFCTIKAKDHHQLKQRYHHRAKSIKLPYETITNEGLLEFGQIEGKNSDLKLFYKFLINKFKIRPKLIGFDGKHISLPIYYLLQEDFKKILHAKDLKPFIVEILPFRGDHHQITEKIPI